MSFAMKNCSVLQLEMEERKGEREGGSENLFIHSEIYQVFIAQQFLCGGLLMKFEDLIIFSLTFT